MCSKEIDILAHDLTTNSLRASNIYQLLALLARSEGLKNLLATVPIHARASWDPIG